MAFKSQTQQYCFQSSFNSCIKNCTLYIELNVKGIALCKVYLKSSNVKLRLFTINPIFNQPNQQFMRVVGANCAFTYMHKTIVGIHPQEMGNNGLVSLVLSVHHLSYHRLSCRAFPITKKITRTRLNLST